MKLLNLISYIILLFGLFSCSQEQQKINTTNKKIKIHYGNFDLIKDFKAIILIPREGCGGCISDATAKTMEIMANRRDILLIFTDVTDMKLLNNQFGNNLLKDCNVTIDTLNLFVDKRVSSIYPQIFYLINGKCVFFETFDITSEKFITL
jgi:hypothetical protein